MCGYLVHVVRLLIACLGCERFIRFDYCFGGFRVASGLIVGVVTVAATSCFDFGLFTCCVLTGLFRLLGVRCLLVWVGSLFD